MDNLAPPIPLQEMLNKYLQIPYHSPWSQVTLFLIAAIVFGLIIFSSFWVVLRRRYYPKPGTKRYKRKEKRKKIEREFRKRAMNIMRQKRKEREEFEEEEEKERRIEEGLKRIRKGVRQGKEETLRIKIEADMKKWQRSRLAGINKQTKEEDKDDNPESKEEKQATKEARLQQKQKDKKQAKEIKRREKFKRVEALKKDREDEKELKKAFRGEWADATAHVEDIYEMRARKLSRKDRRNRYVPPIY